MSSFGGVSSNSDRGIFRDWIIRAFWLGLSAFWIYSLATAVAAKRAGTADSYHNQYSRQIALDSAEILIALLFLTLGKMSRLRRHWRIVVLAAMFGGMAISLGAVFRLAR